MQAGARIGLICLVDNDGRHLECFHCDGSVMDGWRTPVTWRAIGLAE